MEKLFLVINRINSVLFLLLLLGGGGLLTWELVSEMDGWDVARSDQFISVGAEASGRLALSFGMAEMVAGSETVMVPAMSSGSPNLPISVSEATGRLRNVLFVKPDGASAWLFKDGANTIIKIDQLNASKFAPRQPYEPPTEPTKAILVEYVDKDSNGDGMLNRQDKHKVMLAMPDGSGAVSVLEDVDEVLADRVTDAGTALVLYRSGKSIRQGQFALGAFKPNPAVDVGQLPDK